MIYKCPHCNSTNVVIYQQGKNEIGAGRCIDCRKNFTYKVEEDEDE